MASYKFISSPISAFLGFSMYSRDRISMISIEILLLNQPGGGSITGSCFYLHHALAALVGRCFFSYTRESQSNKSRNMCYIKYNTKKDKQDRKVKYGKTTAKLVVKSIFSDSFWCHFSILVYGPCRTI